MNIFRITVLDDDDDDDDVSIHFECSLRHTNDIFLLVLNIENDLHVDTDGG